MIVYKNDTYNDPVLKSMKYEALGSQNGNFPCQDYPYPPNMELESRTVGVILTTVLVIDFMTTTVLAIDLPKI